MEELWDEALLDALEATADRMERRTRRIAVMARIIGALVAVQFAVLIYVIAR